MTNHINRQTYPLELELLDLAGQKSLALLSANNQGQSLELTVTNVSAGTIIIPKGSNSVIQLYFRKGVLENIDQVQLGTNTSNNWSRSTDKSDTTTDLLNLSAVGEQSLQPGQKIVLTLKNVKTVKTQGAHNSGVAFRYQNLTAAGKPIHGHKRQVISLINQLPPEEKEAGLTAENEALKALQNSLGQLKAGESVATVLQQLQTKLGDLETANNQRIKELSKLSEAQKHFPLRAGFASSNIVLNDAPDGSGDKGTASIIQILLTNNGDKPLIFRNTGNQNSDSKLVIEFDVQDNNQKAWAIAEAAQVGKFAYAANHHWTATKHDNGCTLTPPSDNWQLTPGASLWVQISNIRTHLPSGPTNLYIKYQNIPQPNANNAPGDPYPDGELVLTVQKSPLVFAHKRVGLGTTDIWNPLQVRGDIESYGPGGKITTRSNWPGIDKTLLFTLHGQNKDGKGAGAQMRFSGANNDQDWIDIGQSGKGDFTIEHNDHAVFSVSKSSGVSIGKSYAATDAKANNLIVEGKVGIGKKDPAEALHIYGGNLRIDGGEIQSWGPLIFHPDVDKTGDDVIKFVNSNGGENVTIDNQGHVHLKTGDLNVNSGKIRSIRALVFHPDTDKSGDDEVKFLDSTGAVENLRIDTQGHITVKGNSPIQIIRYKNLQQGPYGFDDDLIHWYWTGMSVSEWTAAVVGWSLNGDIDEHKYWSPLLHIRMENWNGTWAISYCLNNNDHGTPVTWEVDVMYIRRELTASTTTGSTHTTRNYYMQGSK